MKIAKGAVIGVGVLAALGASVPGFAGGNKYDSVSETQNCGDNTVAWVGAQMLWPPNHKFQPASITATDASGDNATLTLTPEVLDAVGGDGGANHDPDFQYTTAPTGSGNPAVVGFELRSERSGRGEGRTYRINWSATFDNGSSSCSSDDEGLHPFEAFVPHDMRDKKN